MTKIMLVEDDKSLREIYGVRLLAEGYDIVSAGDGEEALAMAIKERPTLILSDVMMPKISGFDMLDILRSTTETRNIRVIMMTALSSEEQRSRGEQLGADRYLVKSQVGIEDVVRVVHEVLGDTPAPAPVAAAVIPQAAPVTATPPRPEQPAPVAVPQRTMQDVQPAPQPAPVAPVAPQPVAPAATMPIPLAPPVAPVTPVQPEPLFPPQPAPAAAAPLMPTPPPAYAQPQHSSTTPEAPSARNRIIQPLNDPRYSSVNMNDLLDKELAKEAGLDLDARPEISSTAEEKALIDAQINAAMQPQDAQPQTPLDAIATAAPVAPQPLATPPQTSPPAPLA